MGRAAISGHSVCGAHSHSLARTCSRPGAALLCLRNEGAGAQGAQRPVGPTSQLVRRGAEIPTPSDDFQGSLPHDTHVPNNL